MFYMCLGICLYVIYVIYSSSLIQIKKTAVILARIIIQKMIVTIIFHVFEDFMNFFVQSCDPKTSAIPKNPFFISFLIYNIKIIQLCCIYYV